MLLREITGVLATPLVMALLLVGAGLACRASGRQRASRILLICAAVLAYLSSTALIGRGLLRPLEMRYPPLQGDRPPPVGYVVALGSGYVPHDGIPASAALDHDGLVRIVEAVRLARQVPDSRLIVSGGAIYGEIPAARGYALLAAALGIPAQSIIVSDQALDTRGEARAVAKLLGRSPYLLVTSAYHMPRAMWAMREAGTEPIAAPTGQRAFGALRLAWRDFLPGSAGLGDTERALHEYLGLAAIACGLE
jgi:uncharacterized SAM-binding protein YcdF (DUF218 family)